MQLVQDDDKSKMFLFICISMFLLFLSVHESFQSYNSIHKVFLVIAKTFNLL